VFDFDGVILESTNVKTEAFVEVFAEHREHAEAVRAHHLANLGISRFKKFAWIYRNLLGRELDEAESARLGERFSQIVFEKVCSAPFVPGARAAVEALAEAGVPMVVASGTPQDELDRIVDRRGLRPHFVEVHGSPREKRDVIAGVLDRYRCERDELLFVGDGTTDHDAASATGVRFLARETPEFADHWERVGAARVPDLEDLARRVLER
jgi:phosphoglycolate phosphatase-like HAD superfamily hydrolase